MSRKEKKYIPTLLKFGKSEFKRSDIKLAYMNLSYFFIENNNKELTLEQIISEWDRLSIYNSEHKSFDSYKNELSRIKSLCKYIGIGNIQKNLSNRYKIESTEFSQSLVCKKEQYKKFFGLEFEDFWFLQILIKMKNQNNRLILSEIINNFNEDNLFEHKIKWIDYLSKDDRDYINSIISARDKQKIYSLLIPKSSSTNKNEIKEQNNKYIIEITLNYLTDCISLEEYKENIISYLKSDYPFELAEGLDYMIFGEDISKIKKIQKNKIEASKYLTPILANKFDILLRRLVGGVISSYYWLNSSHFNSLSSIFSLVDNEFKVNEQYKDLIIKIIAAKDKISKLDIKKYYSCDELLEILDMNNKEIDKSDRITYLKKVYTNERMIDMFKKMVNNGVVKNNQLDKKKFVNIIGQYVHFKETLDTMSCPLYFEFLVCMSIAVKNNTNWDEEYIRNSLHTLLDTNLVPIRCASGSGSKRIGNDADIKINNNSILIIEPTIEINSQAKQEFEPCSRHLKEFAKNEIEKMKDKNYRNICSEISSIIYITSCIIAPEINDSLKEYVDMYNCYNDNKKEQQNPFVRTKLETKNLQQLIEYLES